MKAWGFLPINMLATLALATLAFPCLGQRLTSQDVLRAESPELFALREQKRYVEALALRLDPSDDPHLILDVIELLLRASIDGGSADKLGRLTDVSSRLAAAVNDPARSASIDQQIARATFFSGSDTAGFEASTQALARQVAIVESGRHPDPTRLFRQLMEHAQLAVSLRKIDILVATLKRAEKLLQKVRNPEHAAVEHDNMLAQVYFALGDMARVRDILASVLDRCNRLGLTGWEAEIQFLLAETYLVQANFTEGEAAAERALALYTAQENLVGAAQSLLQLAAIANSNNAPMRAKGYAERAVNAFDALDDAFVKADSRRELATSAAMIGNVASAKALLNEALRLRPEGTSLGWTYSIARLRTRIALASGDSAFAQQSLQLEDRMREQLQNERGRQHTLATRALFEVSERDLRLQLLERDNEIRRLDIQRNEAQIALQRWWIGGAVVVLVFTLCAAAFLYRRSISLKRVAYTDSLTQIMSRAAILRRLQRALDRARAAGEVVSVIMLDIDRFKGVNDTHGHSAGDAVLKAVAEKISSMSSAAFRVGRIGGDEFIVVLPRTTQSEARDWAERLKQALRQVEVSHHGKTLRVTVSIGVAGSDGEHGDELEQLVHAADAALLAAKRGGRDRVVATSSESMVAAATA